jgi:hypothetical protein
MASSMVRLGLQTGFAITRGECRPHGAAQIRRELASDDGDDRGRAEIFALPTLGKMGPEVGFEPTIRHRFGRFSLESDVSQATLTAHC